MFWAASTRASACERASMTAFVFGTPSTTVASPFSGSKRTPIETAAGIRHGPGCSRTTFAAEGGACAVCASAIRGTATNSRSDVTIVRMEGPSGGKRLQGRALMILPPESAREAQRPPSCVLQRDADPASSGRLGAVLAAVGLLAAFRLDGDDLRALGPRHGATGLAHVADRRLGLAQQRLERARLLDGLVDQRLLTLEHGERRLHVHEQRFGLGEPFLGLRHLALALVQLAARLAQLLQLTEHVLEHGLAVLQLLVRRRD